MICGEKESIQLLVATFLFEEQFRRRESALREVQASSYLSDLEHGSEDGRTGNTAEVFRMLAIF